MGIIIAVGIGLGLLLTIVAALRQVFRDRRERIAAQAELRARVAMAVTNGSDEHAA